MGDRSRFPDDQPWDEESMTPGFPASSLSRDLRKYLEDYDAEKRRQNGGLADGERKPWWETAGKEAAARRKVAKPGVFALGNSGGTCYKCLGFGMMYKPCVWCRGMGCVELQEGFGLRSLFGGRASIDCIGCRGRGRPLCKACGGRSAVPTEMDNPQGEGHPERDDMGMAEDVPEVTRYPPR